MSSWEAIQSFLHLFYPDLCICCWDNLPARNHRFCVPCLTELPFTSHFEYSENRVSQKFWGRADVVDAASLFYFVEGSLIRDMIHKFKYKNKPSIGVSLGKLAGQKIRESQLFKEIDAIVPVPLHYVKNAKRGYNQSERFARGISEVIKIPVLQDYLVKHENTTSQTDKTRLDRYHNVKDSFSLKSKYRNRYKHLLLVDDVITTGATIEACVHTLQEQDDAQVSVLTIAMARNF